MPEAASVIKKEIRNHFISAIDPFVILSKYKCFPFLWMSQLTVTFKPLHERNNGANNCQCARAEHVCVTPHVMAIKAIVFREDDACADKNRDSDVI